MPDHVTTGPAETAAASGTAPNRLPARLAALAEVVLTSGFPTQLAILWLLVAGGLQATTPDGEFSMTFVVTWMLLDAAAMFGLIAGLLRARGERVGTLLFGARPAPQLPEVLLGLALVPLVFGLVIGVLTLVRWIAPWLHNVATNPFEPLLRSPRDAIILGAVVVISGGIKEEVQRAFVLRRFEQHLGGARVGLVVFSVVFGAGHFIQGWDVSVVTALLGLFWGVLYLRRGSVTASAVSHSGFNVAQIVQFMVFGS